MTETYTQGKLVWIDAINPTNEELKSALSAQRIDAAHIATVLAPMHRSGANELSGMLLVSLDFPIVKRTDIPGPHHVRFFVFGKLLLTVRDEEMEAFHRFEKEFEIIGLLYKTAREASGVHIFFALLHELYLSMEAKLDYLESHMRDIEKDIFDGREKKTVVTLSNLSRRLIAFRQALRPHEDVLREAAHYMREAAPNDIAEKFETAIEQSQFISRRTQGLFETFEALRETNTTLLTTKQNEIMKMFTIIAFATLPLTVITQMFGMATTSMPIVGHPSDFWIITGMMSSITLAFFLLAWYKKWF